MIKHEIELELKLYQELASKIVILKKTEEIPEGFIVLAFQKHHILDSPKQQIICEPQNSRHSAICS